MGSFILFGGNGSFLWGSRTVAKPPGGPGFQVGKQRFGNSRENSLMEGGERCWVFRCRQTGSVPYRQPISCRSQAVFLVQAVGGFESELPGNVKVQRIAVRDVNTQADSTIATLEITLFTKEPATISSMIADMHQKGIFQLVLREQNLTKGRGEQGTEYAFDVIYRAPAAYSSESVAGVTRPQDSSEASR